MKPRFFRAPSEFRKWLTKNHASTDELWVGFYKKGSGKPSITWPESVDEALCFGWIDGIRKSIDDLSYQIRFTPRRKGSIWSTININRVRDLESKGLMLPAGLDAFADRKEYKSGIYAYEQRSVEIVEPYAGMFKRSKKAWTFFQAQPPGYRKLANWWIVSAEKEETRLKRLRELIDLSNRNLRLPGISGTKTAK